MIPLLIYSKNYFKLSLNIYKYINKIVKVKYGEKKFMSFSKFSPTLNSVVRSCVVRFSRSKLGCSKFSRSKLSRSKLSRAKFSRSKLGRSKFSR
jgi:hypothetical protein